MGDEGRNGRKGNEGRKAIERFCLFSLSCLFCPKIVPMLLFRLDTTSERATYRQTLLRRAQDRSKNAPKRSLWQSLEWEGYQKALGREARLYGLPGGQKGQGRQEGQKGQFICDATALVIIDRTRGGLAVWDIPRGPIGKSEAVADLLQGIVAEAKREGALAVYFSPSNELKAKSYQLSARKEQPEATVILDLTRSDEELLSVMHEKCRYNIRLAEKRGVVVQESRDVDHFYELLQSTASRDGFTVKPRSHYEKFLTNLPGSFLLLAYGPTGACVSRQINSPANDPVAGLMGVIWGDRGYYYYGASSHEYRSFMAPYVLQWRAMKLCRERGCREYDLLGIEKGTMDKGHPWAGLTRFKLQFGGRIEEYPEERVVILRPFLHAMLNLKRKILG
jgi:lipid II:glycine glycyltransferase (peptidoglycan interpeptide bridge formation enzyme)